MVAREVTPCTAASRHAPTPHTWSKKRIVPGSSPAIKACVSVRMSAAGLCHHKGVGIDEQAPHPWCSRPLDAVARTLSMSLNPETPAFRFSPAASVSCLANLAPAVP
jgi:hypothetical protein